MLALEIIRSMHTITKNIRLIRNILIRNKKIMNALASLD